MFFFLTKINYSLNAFLSTIPPLSCGNVKFQELNCTVFFSLPITTKKDTRENNVGWNSENWKKPVIWDQFRCSLFISANSINKPSQLLLMHDFANQNNKHEWQDRKIGVKESIILTTKIQNFVGNQLSAFYLKWWLVCKINFSFSYDINLLFVIDSLLVYHSNCTGKPFVRLCQIIFGVIITAPKISFHL